MLEDESAVGRSGDGGGGGADPAFVQRVRVDVRAEAEHQEGVLRCVPEPQDALVVCDDVDVDFGV